MTWNVLLKSVGGMALCSLMMDRYGAATERAYRHSVAPTMYNRFGRRDA